MLGAFCRLCHLMSKEKWRLTEKDCELCHFSAPGGQPGKVTINDPLSSFFVVMYHGPEDVASEVCPVIRDTILTGLKQVASSIHYMPQDQATAASSEDQSNSPLLTFVCPCKTDPLHLSTLSDDGRHLTCRYDNQMSMRFTADHRKWLRGATSHVTTSLASSSRQTPAPADVDIGKCLTVLSWREQGEVHRFSLRDQVSTRWRDFGLQLDVTTNMLDGWHRQCLGDCNECWRNVMQHWMNAGHEVYPVMWEGLYNLLEDLQLSEVAGNLRKAVASQPLTII